MHKSCLLRRVYVPPGIGIYARIIMIFRKWQIQSLVVLVLILSLTLCATVEAQSGKGTIKGHVVDPSGDVLQGAQITVEQIDASIFTDVQGDFYVRDLAPGTFAISITYVGFAPSNTTVDVVAGQVATTQ